MANGKLPLEGIRVTDFTWYAAGPLVTKVLAEFGAQVIKIESSTRLDGLRHQQPIADGKTGVNCSGWFNNLNSNKLSITLNMNHPRALDIAKKLIRVSDIVVDNFTPRIMERWGLTPEDILRMKPDVIVVKEPMQGNDGPHKDYLGFGMLLQALGGMNTLMGFPDRPPVGTGIQYTDYSGNPYHTMFAILGALRHRRRTGQGQIIELSQLESSVAITETAILEYNANGRVQERIGNRLPYAAPHGAFRCAGDDRWVGIAVFTDEDWRSFCRVVGNPSWCQDPKFATLSGRLDNVDELERNVEAWTQQRTPEEVMMLLQQAGVAAGVVNTGEDMLVRCPQMRARGHYVYLDHAEAGHTAYDGVTIKMSATPGVMRTPAPLLGEHTDFVCKDILGLTEDEVNELIIEGAFE